MNNAETNKAVTPAIQLQPVFDAMLEAMIVIDSTGIISEANKSATTIFGYSHRELVGANIKMLMDGRDKVRHAKYIERYEKTRKKRIIGIGREVVAARKDGSTFPASIAVGEVKAGGQTLYVGLIRDITEQRRTEEAALKQREEIVNVSRLSMMGEMAAAMAHELNQPLTAIANFAAASTRLLHTDVETNLPTVLEALQDIEEQAHRAGEVILRTRTFTHSPDMEKQITDLTTVFEQINSLAQLDTKANNIRLSIQIPDNLPEVEVDPVQIQQVMLNLIRNAVDSMSDTQPSEREISIRAIVSGPRELRFQVRDHGSGIKKEDAANVFNAFFTTKPTGMGMGLAICHTIIRNHGGELRFRHNDPLDLASGMTFFFTLPTKVRK